MTKKERGAFYTKNAEMILEKYKHIVKNKTIVDPFVGEGDLIDWAKNNGAKSCYGIDINKDVNPDEVCDTIMNPKDYSKYDSVLMNPPYLLNNKTENNKPFKKWGVSDLYKASLLSVAETANEIIAIIPSNMFLDKDDKFRERFFDKMKILSVEWFEKQVFPDTNTRVCVIHAIRGKTIKIDGHELYNTRIGKDWNILLENGTKNTKRLTIGGISNSSITIRTTDTGSKNGDISASIDTPFYGKISDRNKFTVIFPEKLTKNEEERIVKRFNRILNFYRRKYNSNFLTNFLPGKDGRMRKRISFKEALSLLSILYNMEKNKKEKK